MDDLRSAGFPRWWSAPLNPFIIQYVIVDWLYREVDPYAEEKMPTLRAIHGYRNIEVYGYLKETSVDRQEKICLAVYGSAGLPENVRYAG
jgi:hypothetical protein